MQQITIPTTGTRLSAQEGLRLWEKICSYSLPFDEHYLCYKLKWEEEFARKAIPEYLRFVFLAYLSSSEVTPSEVVDEVWHLHILHTEAYAAFAERCGRFLHHWPGMPTQRKRWNSQYERTRWLYQMVFSAVPDQGYWPYKSRGKAADRASIANVLQIYRKGTVTAVPNLTEW